jgi:chitin disaccharide deacetylase
VRLILNADDFGLSEDTLASTVACFEEDLLTSASIMVGVPATEHALDFARTRPGVAFGVHVNLVGDGVERPISPPEQVPALVDGEGRLLPTRLVRMRALVGRLPVDQLEREISAQVGYVRDAGIPVTHVDSHRHVHKLPTIREGMRRALAKLGIRRIRNVQDVYLRRPLRSPTYWLGASWRGWLMREFDTTTHAYMPTSAHDVAWQDALLERCARLSGGLMEIGVHPGTVEAWRDDERRSLAAFVPAARAAGHQLVSWRDV